MNNLSPNAIIIDFDSTFIQVEALDELAKIALQNNENAPAIIAKIASITQQGMNGEMSFDATLQQRIALLCANKKHLALLIKELEKKISTSFLQNKKYIQDYAENIYIISGGFLEYVLPIVLPFGIKKENVFANEFIFDEKENIIGFDSTNILCQEKGKVKLVQQLNLPQPVVVIGDGFTDYQIKEAGLAKAFYLFIENVQREKLVNLADFIIPSLDKFIQLTNQNNSKESFPKNKIKVLLLENVHANALNIFNEETYQIENCKVALNENELIEKIKDVHILGIRSKSQVTPKVLEHANKLMSIGAFCIGTNQIDTKVCAQKGIAVFNAPYSNTRSVVELALAEMIILMRNVVTKNAQMHNGVWDKSAKNSFEIRGKTLGLVGYGNIGTQFSVLAEALGMQVLFYDIADKLSLGNAKKCNTLQELLQKADVVSLHVDGRTSNACLIGEKEFQQMKDNVIFLNLSRGHIVDLEALQNAIKSGKVWGASIDVYPYEPASNDEEFKSTLRQLPNTILTPHIGGSTEEAQANIGEFVPHKIVHYINKGDTYGAVNFPEVQLPSFQNSHRFLHIHKNIPGILAQINAVFAKNNVNIQAQFLKTNDEIGYVITDVATNYNIHLEQEIKAIEGTVKFRMLY